MNVSKINTGFTAMHFLSNNAAKQSNGTKSDDDKKVPVLVNITSDKLNNALKATVLIPAVSLPLIMGSCSKDDDYEYWADGGGTSITYPSIYILPELQIDSIKFAKDSVRLPLELSPNGKVNSAIKNIASKMNIPNDFDGDFPIRLAYQSPDFVKCLTLDGLASKDDKYIYDVQQFNKNGSMDIYKTEVTADDDILRLKNLGFNNNSEFEFELQGDSLLGYKKVNGEFEKYATYKPENRKSILEIKENGDTTKINNINLLFVKSQCDKK